MAVEDSEFGGHAGLIQPLPHSPNAREQAFLERASAADDATDGPEVVLADVLAGTYGAAGKTVRTPLPEAAEILPLVPDVMLVATSPDPGIGFGFVGVGNIDLRSAQLKVSSSSQMYPASYGPKKAFNASVAPLVQLEIGSLLPGHYYYQVVMNDVQVTQVWEVDVV